MQSIMPSSSVTQVDHTTKGDWTPQRFAQLYRANMTRVYRYLLVKLGNEQDAQDVTSQVFMAALERIESFRGSAPVEVWLLRIARNKSADFYRKQRTIVEIDDALPDSADSPLDQTHRTLQFEQVARHLRLIAPDRAEAIALRTFGGLDFSEIAAVMGKKEPAVRMLASRGLRDLKQRLGALEGK